MAAATALVSQWPLEAFAAPPSSVAEQGTGGEGGDDAGDEKGTGGSPGVAVQRPEAAADAAMPSPERPSVAPGEAVQPRLAPPLVLQPTAVASDQLALTGTSLWAGLVGRRVILSTDDGRMLDGRLISQSLTAVAMARGEDGKVMSVDKVRVTGVNVPPRTDIPPGDGTGLLAGGGVLLGLGIPVTISGLVFAFLSPYLGLMFLPGPMAVGAGIPMVVVGSRRRADYRRALIRASPNLSVTPTGGTGGVTLRF